MGNWFSAFVMADGRGRCAAELENRDDDVVAWEGTPRGVLSPLVVSLFVETRPTPMPPPPSLSRPPHLSLPLPMPETSLQPVPHSSPEQSTFMQPFRAPFHDHPRPPSNIPLPTRGDPTIPPIYMLSPSPFSPLTPPSPPPYSVPSSGERLLEPSVLPAHEPLNTSSSNASRNQNVASPAFAAGVHSNPVPFALSPPKPSSLSLPFALTQIPVPQSIGLHRHDDGANMIDIATTPPPPSSILHGVSTRHPHFNIGDVGKLTPSRKRKKRPVVEKKSPVVDLPSHLEHREYCHTYSSKGCASSQRTRAAAGAHISWATSKLLSRNTLKNRKRYAKKKKEKQLSRLHNIVLTDEMVQAGARFSPSFLKDNIVVFDGGMESSTAGAPPDNTIQEWECIPVVDGPLVICDPPSKDEGLMFLSNGDEQPRFILLPRSEAVSINANGRGLCSSMGRIAKKQASISRGSSKTVFGGNKYCCIGAKANRSSPGVTPGLFKLDGLYQEDWDCVVRAVKRCEHAFFSYASSDTIAHIREARNLVHWEGIYSSGIDGMSDSAIYNGIAFGINVFLRAHVDDDFTYSVIQVHVDEVDYTVHDDVVCYFCFPRLGVAVPLRPGDFLLVNALEYHCLSSRCAEEQNLFCVSSYLKTAVVGGNDNSKVLNHEEDKCMRLYDKHAAKKRRL